MEKPDNAGYVNLGSKPENTEIVPFLTVEQLKSKIAVEQSVLEAIQCSLSQPDRDPGFYLNIKDLEDLVAEAEARIGRYEKEIERTLGTRELLEVAA